MRNRSLGKTGETLSVIGCGAIVFCEEDDAFARDTISRAVDAGITYFDVGPSYCDGEAERRMGPALQPYRDRVFLAEKTTAQTKQGAADALRASLQTMCTDRFDLYQLHGVTSKDDVETILGPGGALEAFVEARDRGWVRFLGFSAHSEEAALAMMDAFAFDTILFPVNYVCWYQGNFGPAVLARAREKQMGILALKTLAKKPWPDPQARAWPKIWYSPVDTYEEAKRALNWTLSRPVTACVPPGHAEFLWWMIDAEKEFTPLTPEDEEAMKQAARSVDPIFPTEPAWA